MAESIHGYTLGQDFWTPQQREAFVKSLPLPEFFYAMDPRTGKSKPNVDKACFYFERKAHPLHISGVLVVAWPNGVHRGWISDAFPENVPSRIKWKGFVWRATDANLASKRQKKAGDAPPTGYMRAFLDMCEYKGLAVFAVNAEATNLVTTQRAIDYFLKRRQRVMCIADETCFMAEPSSQRSKFMSLLGRRRELVIKSCLDGTPVDGTPFGYFAPCRFLNPAILGFDDYQLFQAHYAELRETGDKMFWEATRSKEAFLIKNGASPGQALATAKKLARAKGRFWTEIEKDHRGYPKFKNMDELHERLDPISYRATFAQCFNTPRKVYQKRYFELSREQRRVYEELREEYRTMLNDGTEVTAVHHLTRMLRAQQICSNHIPAQNVLSLHEPCTGLGCEACGHTGVVETEVPPRIIDPENNPRLDALRLELTGRPTIVWCRFRQDAADAYNLAKEMGLTPCLYNGMVNAKEKVDAKDGFQSGKYQTIIGNQASMARGLPLWRAYGHVFYSNSFSRRDRLQGEDRAEIAHRTVGTSIVDLVAEDSIDDLVIMPALKMKVEISDMIMKDPKRVWI